MGKRLIKQEQIPTINDVATITMLIASHHCRSSTRIYDLSMGFSGVYRSILKTGKADNYPNFKAHCKVLIILAGNKDILLTSCDDILKAGAILHKEIDYPKLYLSQKKKLLPQVYGG